ncbi:hypothetical protein BDZ89DRAFT_908645, partial [Hymenopellis radicata]
LSEYDQRICQAFAYKMHSRMTDAAFEMFPLGIKEAEPPLPTLHSIRKRAEFLSGFKPDIYHCCINSCCCFAGPNKDLDKCPHCKEARLGANGKPRKVFVYIPLIPRLLAYAKNIRVAEQMRYRAEHKPSSEDNVEDIFDALQYHRLCRRLVHIGRQLQHKYFSDARDVALGLSTDGFCPHKRRKTT